MNKSGSSRGLSGRILRSAVLFAVAFALYSGGALSQSGPEKKSADGDESLRWISRCLSRLGEKALAKRVLNDRFGTSTSNPSDPANVFYAANRTIRIADLGGEGVNAETGYDEAIGQNVMTLDVSVLTLADSRKLLAKRPYHPEGAGLFEWTITVLHEYVHMDQKNPQLSPAFEDPAWHTVNKTMLKWYGQMESEFEALAKDVPSDEKGVKLAELEDLAKSLKSAYGPHFEAIDRNVRDQALTADQVWEAPGASSKDTKVLLGSVNTTLGRLIEKIKAEIGKNAKSSLKGAGATGKAAVDPLSVPLRFARIRWTASGQGQSSKAGGASAAIETTESGGFGSDVQIPLLLEGNHFSGTLELKEKDITRQITLSGDIDRDLGAVRNLKVSGGSTHAFSDRTGGYDFRDDWEFTARELKASKTLSKADLAIKSLAFTLRYEDVKDVPKFRYSYKGQSVEKTLTSLESMSLKVNLDQEALPKSK